jgi:hypothetical protein
VVRLDAHPEPFGPALTEEQFQDMKSLLLFVGELWRLTGIEKRHLLVFRLTPEAIFVIGIL